MQAFNVCLFLLLANGFAPSLATSMSTARHRANPIRKVVTMLQMMQKKVTEEGEAEQKLFDKFMCYCKNGAGSLGKSIQAAETKIPQLESDLKAGEAEKAQLAADIKQHQADREEALKTRSEAKAIREKAAAAFAKEQAEQKADLAAMTNAVGALEKGGVGFLQTPAASILRRLAVSADLSMDTRDTLTSFLSEGTDEDGEGPSGGEIVGILKNMKETMAKEKAGAQADEAAAIKESEALDAAKTKEVDSLSKAVEVKTARVGELGVELVDTEADLSDTAKSLAEDKKVLANLEESCDAKSKEWEETQKTRSAELVALSDTIKLLNDDDALELFKKAIPSASASFLQLKVTSKEVVSRAREALQASFSVRDYRLDLISMAMRGGKVNFDKVLGMVDDMVALLKKEQVDDDKKKSYCEKGFNEAGDEEKDLKRSKGNSETTIEDLKEMSATSVEEINSLQEGIKALDKAVAEATANRKEENAAYVEELAANNAAIELIKMAKNRMNKFYNPKLYKALVQTEQSPSFVQISAHLQHKATHSTRAYHKKADSSGVIAMMDTLIADVQKEVTEMKTGEKLAQAEYEKFMEDSASKRAIDAKSVAEKEAVKADTASKLQKNIQEKKAIVREQKANLEYQYGLHQECDWLVQNYDARKTARAGESDSLTKAKAVLSGADFA